MRHLGGFGESSHVSFARAGGENAEPPLLSVRSTPTINLTFFPFSLPQSPIHVLYWGNRARWRRSDAIGFPGVFQHLVGEKRVSP